MPRGREVGGTFMGDWIDLSESDQNFKKKNRKKEEGKRKKETVHTWAEIWTQKNLKHTHTHTFFKFLLMKE